jgi:hypothetical protein
VRSSEATTACLIPECLGLDVITDEIVWKFFRRVDRIMDAYRSGDTYGTAELKNKVYKSHRRVAEFSRTHSPGGWQPTSRGGWARAKSQRRYWMRMNKCVRGFFFCFFFACNFQANTCNHSVSLFLCQICGQVTLHQTSEGTRLKCSAP